MISGRGIPASIEQQPPLVGARHLPANQRAQAALCHLCRSKRRRPDKFAAPTQSIQSPLPRL
jgi:hypothetical protein